VKGLWARHRLLRLLVYFSSSITLSSLLENSHDKLINYFHKGARIDQFA